MNKKKKEMGLTKNRRLEEFTACKVETYEGPGL